MVSVHPRFAAALAAGTKSVELRRRFPDVAAGAPLALYTTAPIAALTGIGVIEVVDRQAPAVLWERYQARAGITRDEFDAYFEGCAVGCAVVLRRHHRVARPLSIGALAEAIPGFRAPQAYRFVDLAALGLDAIGRRRPEKTSGAPTEVGGTPEARRGPRGREGERAESSAG